MEPADDHPAAQAGSPESAKGLDAERPYALVATTVTVGVPPASAHAGAVHTMRLAIEVLCAVASEPVVALHANVRVLDWGSWALTSKVTGCPAEAERADW
jgi:hypothetical protein